jgi:hypothetical protein
VPSLFITHVTLLVCQAEALAEQASVETTHVGAGTVVEQPPEKLMVSDVAIVVQPPPAVEESTLMSY